MHPSHLNGPEDAEHELHALMQDKLETHCRQQLSALVDGALPPDEARFLLRRLQHDGALAGRWERWQVYGECMRGGVSQLLPADFSQRVCAALEAEAGSARVVSAIASSRTARPAWARWAGGAALAASVAMAAFVVVQRDPQQAGGALQVASTAPGTMTPSSPAASDAQTPGGAPAPTEGAALPSGAAAGAVLLAARDLPRRTQSRASTAGRAAQSPVTQRAVESAVPVVAQDAPLQAIAVANAGPAASVQADRDPFYAEVAAQARPWPRAVLPGLVQGGGFSVAYGATSADASGFEPFEPRIPVDADASSDSSEVRIDR